MAQASFTNQLLHAISAEKTTENIILSPVSIKSCLVLTYLGAEGETASEMENVLQLNDTRKEVIAAEYTKLFEKTTANDDASLIIANRVYIDEKYDIATKYNELAQTHFHTQAEKVKFADATPTAQQINQWVAQQTENKIRNIISPDSLTTAGAILVNAIYFKAKWVNSFDGYATKMSDFSVSATRKVQVDMMSQEDKFRYAELEDLDAQALEMAYINTDLTMLLILPKALDGLKELEQKLQNIELNTISKLLKTQKVKLHLPKFKIEFDVSLQPILEQLGLKKMFSHAANFSSLLANNDPLRIVEVKHKAFMEINEEGTEAAASTYAKAYLELLVLNEVIYDFVADHPFFFAIKDNEHVYFAGHVAQF